MLVVVEVEGALNLAGQFGEYRVEVLHPVHLRNSGDFSGVGFVQFIPFPNEEGGIGFADEEMGSIYCLTGSRMKKEDGFFLLDA